MNKGYLRQRSLPFCVLVRDRLERRDGTGAGWYTSCIPVNVMRETTKLGTTPAVTTSAGLG